LRLEASESLVIESSVCVPNVSQLAVCGMSHFCVLHGGVMADSRSVALVDEFHSVVVADLSGSCLAFLDVAGTVLVVANLRL